MKRNEMNSTNNNSNKFIIMHHLFGGINSSFCSTQVLLNMGVVGTGTHEFPSYSHGK